MMMSCVKKMGLMLERESDLNIGDAVKKLVERKEDFLRSSVCLYHVLYCELIMVVPLMRNITVNFKTLIPSRPTTIKESHAVSQYSHKPPKIKTFGLGHLKDLPFAVRHEISLC